ncbi:hypothetical protein EDB86DRAFT_3082287 [Lactarius hatsudake]|nr:hypothetical protein EDB86DRAFT_3082287 [Lactarius hatsudake]
MTQICQQISPFLPSVQTLSVPMLCPWRDSGQGTYWVDFLRVFNRLEKLHIFGGDLSKVVHTLRFVSTGMATDVLPVLRELSFDSDVYGPRSREAVTSFLDVEVRLEHAHEPSYKFSTIEVVPDDVILEIFHFYKSAYKSGSREWQGRWHGLAHVCRRWRTIIFEFASQDRLDLRLVCTPSTSVKQTLDLWPGFPILVRNIYFPNNWENIIDALQQRDRVCEIDLQGPLSEEVSQILQEPFPLLDRLVLNVWDSSVLTCPSTFLGGSAPRLRVLHLDVFQSSELKLPRILSSADQLVDLRIERVESTKCIPPEALVAALSAMTRLKTLYLRFLRGTFHSNPMNISPLSSRRIVSSALLRLTFDGPCNYLEHVLSRITAPSLECTRLQFFAPPTSEPHFNISQLSQFLSLVESQNLPDGVEMRYRTLSFYHSSPESVALPGGQPKGSEWLRFELPHYWQQASLELPLMTQFCQQLFPFLSNVRTLSIPILRQCTAWRDDRHGTLWMDFLRAFNRVERLHLSGNSSHTVVDALRLVSSGMATGVLPALHELNLDSVLNMNESQKTVTSFLNAHNHAGSSAITFQWLDDGLY